MKFFYCESKFKIKKIFFFFVCVWVGGRGLRGSRVSCATCAGSGGRIGQTHSSA